MLRLHQADAYPGQPSDRRGKRRANPRRTPGCAVSYQSVQTANGFHVEGTDVASGRIDWSDGSYAIIGSTDHFALNTTAGTTVSKEAHVDFGDNYSADGVFLGHITFHAVSHLTVTNGVITRVSFEFNHLHLFGSDCSP
ncbi:MAG TPA: hypothetical protein VN714_24435 [Trebonia sp.]|nr:hypothetical protein [Trebonia sp.]